MKREARTSLHSVGGWQFGSTLRPNADGKIIRALYKSTSLSKLDLVALARKLSVDKAQIHLHKLEEAGYVEQTGDKVFELTAQGLQTAKIYWPGEAAPTMPAITVRIPLAQSRLDNGSLDVGKFGPGID